VLDGDPAPPWKGHNSPLLFSVHVYCGHGRPSQLLMSSGIVEAAATTSVFQILSSSEDASVHTN